MSDYRINRVFKIQSELSASVWLPNTVSTKGESPDVDRVWGFMVPTGSAAGTVYFESGSIDVSEVEVGRPYPAYVDHVTITQDHIYLLR